MLRPILHGTFEEPGSTAVVFSSDQVIDNEYTFLPHLEAFRFLLVGHDSEFAMYLNVMQFLHRCKRLRRLDLGTCPWDLVLQLLPELSGLRALGVRIVNLTLAMLDSLVMAVPQEMAAINVGMLVSDKLLNVYADAFGRFHSLALCTWRAYRLGTRC
ncbi:hypothetical protein DXG01_015061 [Tephrocybe rancida]|nr:hypothetical protein DXG01_015061 [Tephrocybe rancida]